MQDDNQEIIEEFLVEGRESIAEIESTLIELEQAGGDAELDDESLNRVFRTFHSMKGTAGFLGFSHLVSVTHKAESLLDRVRKREDRLTRRNITLLCRALDFAARAVDTVEESGTDETLAAPAVALGEDLQAALDGRAPVSIAPVEPDPEPSVMPPADDDDGKGLALVFGPPTAPVVNPRATSIDSDDVDDDHTNVEEDHTNVEEEPRRKVAPVAKEPKPPVKAPEPRVATANSSIRVDVDKLDQLMNLVGELIIAERMVTHNNELTGLELENFHKAALQLNRITRSLQDVAMSTRMLPVRNLFRKMLRLVRDLSMKQGKQIVLDLHGEGTEVDKSVIEAIGDPLVHLLRNACDHGIDTVEERIAAGKSPRGTVRLGARHQGGEVHITIEDDGRGIDRDKVLAKAIERGIISGTGEHMKDSEVFQLIFAPGFSTAAQVTDISGRGVGMDVVKRNIEKLRGRVEVTSTLGKGSRFTLRIPLTLAIVEGMLVRVDDMLCTIPLLSIRESVSGHQDRVTTLPDGRDVVHYRGEFLPLLPLRDFYSLPGEAPGDGGTLVVVEDGERQLGVVVDELIGQRQTVIKALPSFLGNPRGLSGCSILSNGEISLILDINSLMAQCAA